MDINITQENMADINVWQWDNTEVNVNEWNISLLNIWGDIIEVEMIQGWAGTGVFECPVTSVFGRTWDIVATDGDYNADQIDDSTTTNKFTNQTDIDRLANTSWTNTGDQDLTNYLDKTSNPYIEDVVAWTDVTIDKTDPKNPIINASSWVDESLAIAYAVAL